MWGLHQGWNAGKVLRLKPSPLEILKAAIREDQRLFWWKEFFAKASLETRDPGATRASRSGENALCFLKHLLPPVELHKYETPSTDQLAASLFFFFLTEMGFCWKILLFRCFFWRAFCGFFFFFVRGILCHSAELHLVSCHFLSVCSVANEFSVPAAVGSVAIQPGTDGTLALTDKTSLASPAHVVSPTACYYTANIWRCACTESYRPYKNITLIVNPCFTKMKGCLYSFLFHSSFGV